MATHGRTTAQHLARRGPEVSGRARVSVRISVRCRVGARGRVRVCGRVKVAILVRVTISVRVRVRVGVRVSVRVTVRVTVTVTVRGRCSVMWDLHITLHSVSAQRALIATLNTRCPRRGAHHHCTLGLKSYF